MHEFVQYRVRHAMSRSPVTIDPRSSLAEAEAIFDKHDFNALPVVGTGRRLLGLLTKLDLLKAFAFDTGSAIPRYKELMRRSVEEAMTREPEAVDPELPLTRVLEMMIRTRYKSVPVAEGGALVGMIAREDVLRALRRAVAGKGPEGG